jgi:hypothetical protein
MRFYLFICCLLACAFVTEAPANVGATSAGVTTTTGGQNDPSSEVQQQSSGFVQQNQQMPNAQGPNGMALPAGAANTDPTAKGSPSENKASAANGAGVSATPPAVPATPPPPPPPPPIYESTMRRIERRADTAKAPASTPPAVVVPSSKPQEKVTATAPVEKVPAPPAPTVKPAPAETRVKTSLADNSSERVATPPAVTGGRGAAPDGVTFFSGIAIAGALLAFGFFTFVRIGRNERP